MVKRGVPQFLILIYFSTRRQRILYTWYPKYSTKLTYLPEGDVISSSSNLNIDARPAPQQNEVQVRATNSAVSY